MKKAGMDVGSGTSIDVSIVKPGSGADGGRTGESAKAAVGDGPEMNPPGIEFHDSEKVERPSGRTRNARNEAVFVVPDQDTLLGRLMEVDDNPYVVARFYPHVLAAAGRELVGIGAVMMLTLAIHDFVQGMPAPMERLMHMRFERYLEAVVPDAAALKEAKEFYARTQAG